MYFFHHYELPAIEHQARVHTLLTRAQRHINPVTTENVEAQGSPDHETSPQTAADENADSDRVPDSETDDREVAEMSSFNTSILSADSATSNQTHGLSIGYSSATSLAGTDTDSGDMYCEYGSAAVSSRDTVQVDLHAGGCFGKMLAGTGGKQVVTANEDEFVDASDNSPAPCGSLSHDRLSPVPSEIDSLMSQMDAGDTDDRFQHKRCTHNGRQNSESLPAGDSIEVSRETSCVASSDQQAAVDYKTVVSSFSER